MNITRLILISNNSNDADLTAIRGESELVMLYIKKVDCMLVNMLDEREKFIELDDGTLKSKATGEVFEVVGQFSEDFMFVHNEQRSLNDSYTALRKQILNLSRSTCHMAIGSERRKEREAAINELKAACEELKAKGARLTLIR